MRKFDVKFQDAKQGAAITVKITPRARKTEAIGLMEDGTIRIRVAGVPVEGAANDRLIAFLSEVLELPKDQIDIVAGQTSERKLISLIGITPARVEAVFAELITASEKTRAAKHRADHKKKTAGGSSRRSAKAARKTTRNTTRKPKKK